MSICNHGHLALGDLLEGDDPFDIELASEPDLADLVVYQVDFINNTSLRFAHCIYRGNLSIS